MRNHSLFPESQDCVTTNFNSSVPNLLNVLGVPAAIDINIKPIAVQIPEFNDNENSFPVVGNDFSAAGVVSKQNLRKQKAHKFRLKRRELKMKLYGSEFNVRDGTKNPMRQIAAL